MKIAVLRKGRAKSAPIRAAAHFHVMLMPLKQGKLKMIKWLPKWSLLSKIQNIKAVKSMYIWLFIVPIIAKALSKAEDIAEVKIFEYSFEVELGLPFSWKTFYFSALAFAVANFIFLARSYSLIKDHDSFSSFIEHGKADDQLKNYANQANIDVPETFPGSGNYPPEFRAGGKHLQPSFWKIYDKIDNLRPYWRFICSLLYLIGFSLMALILYQNLATVIRLSF